MKLNGKRLVWKNGEIDAFYKKGDRIFGLKGKRRSPNLG
jgi:hypothetical protein